MRRPILFLLVLLIASFPSSDRVSAMLQNDGVHTHGAVTFGIGDRWAITLLAIRLEEPGITVGTRF